MPTRFNPFTGKLDLITEFVPGLGTDVLYGSGIPPSSLGGDTDVYINVDNGDQYQKLAGVWVLQFGRRQRVFQPIPTNGQTIFNLPSNYLDIGTLAFFINGNRLKNGEDYTVSGTTIIFISTDYQIESDDEIEITYFETT